MWRDRLEVFIGPGEVRAARTRGGWRQLMKRSERQYRRVEWAEQVGDEPSHAPMLQALADAIAGGPPADVHLVLSNETVRFALLPHLNALRNEAERDAAARHALRAIYFEQADGWRVVHGGIGRAGSGIAAGIDARLLDDVLATLAAANARVVSIVPLLAHAFGESRSLLREHGAAWFAVVESSRVVFARLDGTHWRALRSHRLRAGAMTELAALLEQARLTDGVDAPDQRVVVATLGAAPLKLPDVGRWQFEAVALAHGAFGA